MDEKRTLGGTKKYIFAPKKAKPIEKFTINNFESEIKEEIQITENKPKIIKKDRKDRTISIFTALDKTTSLANCNLNDENEEAEEYSKYRRDRKYLLNKNENFEDDNIYLFSGLELDENNLYFLDFDDCDRVYIGCLDNDSKIKMENFGCDKMKIVKIDENIHEVGDVFQVYNAYCEDF